MSVSSRISPDDLHRYVCALRQLIADAEDSSPENGALLDAAFALSHAYDLFDLEPKEGDSPEFEPLCRVLIGSHRVFLDVMNRCGYTSHMIRVPDGSGEVIDKPAKKWTRTVMSFSLTEGGSEESNDKPVLVRSGRASAASPT
jgi:hypothetical protein